MSKIHQAQFVLFLVCSGVGLAQAQGLLIDQYEPWTRVEGWTGTHWDQVLFNSLRAFIWVNVLIFIGYFGTQLLEFWWFWLGGI